MRARARRGGRRLFANAGGMDARTGVLRWASVPFTLPATLDTVVAVNPDLKAHVRTDLETFTKGHAYYHWLISFSRARERAAATAHTSKQRVRASSGGVREQAC